MIKPIHITAFIATLIVSTIAHTVNYKQIVPYNPYILHDAVKSGDPHRVKQLVEAGMDVNQKDAKGNTPLHCANRTVTEISPQTVASIVKKSQKYNLYKNHEPYETKADYLEQANRASKISALFIDRANEIIAKDSEVKKLAIITYLLQNGANPNVTNNKGNTPLHGAAKQNNSEVVDLLLASKSCPHQKNNAGQTPLHYAAAPKGLQPLTQLYRTNKQIQKAVKYVLEEEEEVCEKLLSNLTEEAGITIIEALIDARASTLRKDKNGQTPYDIASKGKYPKITDQLKRPTDFYKVVYDQLKFKDFCKFYFDFNRPKHQSCSYRRLRKFIDLAFNEGASSFLQQLQGKYNISDYIRSIYAPWRLDLDFRDRKKAPAFYRYLINVAVEHDNVRLVQSIVTADPSFWHHLVTINKQEIKKFSLHEYKTCPAIIALIKTKHALMGAIKGENIPEEITHYILKYVQL